MDLKRNTPVTEDPEIPEPNSDEEDFELLLGFDPDQATDRLYNFSNSIRLKIGTDHQKEMHIQVGANLSNEHPWKQISKQFLEDHIVSDTYELKVLKEKLKEIEGDPLLLIGYCPHLSGEEGDTFIIYLDEMTCKEASEIVRRLEAAERRKIKQTIVKRPKPYVSMGSEMEVDLFVKSRRTNLVDLEMQSVYPMRFSDRKKFQLRLSGDVRDGYVELVPGKKSEFQNVFRKCVDRAAQSAALKVTQDVQTQPVFPTNAWSQYLYSYDTESTKDKDTETDIAESEFQDEDKEERSSLMLERKKSKTKAEPIIEVNTLVEETPTPSRQIEKLLDILEFNTIDLYRNDYPFIARCEIQKYQTPYMEEICCFVDIPKCKGRVVTSVDWHPEFSGVCVVAYGFNSPCIITRDDDDIDEINRSVMETNPVLIWSFDDTLYPKLELEALKEISVISFCPYDGNIVVGGTVNGQLIIWDITDRLKNVEVEEQLSPDQAKNRSDILSFLSWKSLEEAKKIIFPAAISSLEYSHKDMITTIKWLPRNYFCTHKGHLKEDREHNTTTFRQFVTTSKDGTIMFWDLDWDGKDVAQREMGAQLVKLPDELQETCSPFKKMDQIFRPQFRTNLHKPISSFAFDEGKFQFEALSKVSAKGDINQRILHKVTGQTQKNLSPKMVVGLLLGEIYMVSWDSYDKDQGAIMKPEIAEPEPFMNVHDGPVISVERNHFLSNIFLSIGGSIIALWHEDYRNGPIFWRHRPNRLTAVRWSLDRPSVFFLASVDGNLEIWDLNTRIDSPAMTECLGGNVITHLLQHKLSLPKKVLSVADYNSNLRIFLIPSAFVFQLQDETQILKKFVEDEVERKTEQEKWKMEWYTANKDIIEAKKLAEEQVKAENEKREKDKKEMEDYKQRCMDDEAKKRAIRKANRMVYDLPERLNKKWDEQHYKRLLKIMMERKKVDTVMLERQTKILKDRMKYDEQKKLAIRRNFAKIDEDLAAIRARLVPAEEYQATREELVQESIEVILTVKPIYQKAEEEAMKKVKAHDELKPMTMTEIHERIKRNRTFLSKRMGGYNVERRERYERYKVARREGKTGRINSISPGSRERSVTFSSDIRDHDENDAGNMPSL